MAARRLAGNFGLFDVRRIDFGTVDLRLVAIFGDAKKSASDEWAKVVSVVAPCQRRDRMRDKKENIAGDGW